MNFVENTFHQILLLLCPRVLIDLSENGVYLKRVLFLFTLLVQAGNKKVYAVDMLFILFI